MEPINNIFVKRLNLAFETIVPVRGTTYSPSYIQKATNNAITGSYIRQLRAGEVENPSIKVIGILSDFFKVPPSYFLEEDISQVSEKRRLLTIRLVERSKELTDDELESMSMIIDIMKSMWRKDNIQQSDSEE